MKFDPNSGERFQRQLSQLVRDKGCKTIVETGLGESTQWILKAFENAPGMERAVLFSVDPKPWFTGEISDYHHVHIAAKSEDALADIYKKTGPWDLFLHDSNHDLRCMTLELHFAHRAVKPGGIIACDDHSWSNGDVWKRFCNQFGLSPVKLGSVEYVVKRDESVIDPEMAGSILADCISKATEEESKWLSLGNKNSGVFG